MRNRRLSVSLACLATGVSLLGFTVAGCNKQPNSAGVATVAPPIAALPMVAEPGNPPPPAPAAADLPAPSSELSFAPASGPNSYGYIDQAYTMGEAFADTPPDYAVDYDGTRPWIWRSRNGAYRVVERLDRGERVYYYRAGDDYPYLIRDPDYSYAYDNGDLVAVYGPDGSEMEGPEARRYGDRASREFYRGRDLYHAAQYDQRQSAYANEWEGRQAELHDNEMAWGQEQQRNPQWHQWHDQHQSDEQRQWTDERNQRVAYASAIGLGVAAVGTALNAHSHPNPSVIAQKQAAYFSSWNANHGGAQGQASTGTGSPGLKQGATVAPPQTQEANAHSEMRAAKVQTNAAGAPKSVGPTSTNNIAEAQKSSALTAARTEQVAHSEAAAAANQHQQSMIAQQKSNQAAHAEQVAAEASKRQSAEAQAKSVEAANARQAAAEAQRRQAAALQAKNSAAAHSHEAAQAARAQGAAAQAKQQADAAAQARSAEAARARQSAAQAQQKEAAAAQAKSSEAAHARQAAAQANAHAQAAAKAQAAHSQAAAAAAQKPAPQKPGNGNNHKKHDGGKDNPQQQ